MDTLKAMVSKIPQRLLWGFVGLLSLLLAHNALLYFTHGGEYGLLVERTEARKNVLWTICLYIHLPSGVICLLSPLMSFARNLGDVMKRFHSRIGVVYIWVTLLLVCPTGMYLGLYAKGGVVTVFGFLLQGLLLGYYTCRGYQERKRDKECHINYMILSYSVAAVVLSFRLFHILFFLLKVPYLQNYAISQWLGLSFNLLIAQTVIYFRSRKNPSLKISAI